VSLDQVRCRFCEDFGAKPRHLGNVLAAFACDECWAEIREARVSPGGVQTLPGTGGGTRSEAQRTKKQ